MRAKSSKLGTNANLVNAIDIDANGNKTLYIYRIRCKIKSAKSANCETASPNSIIYLWQVRRPQKTKIIN